MFNLDCTHRSSLMGTTLRAVRSKSHAFSTNYHACIAVPTWRRCAPPILFWCWPPYNLLPRLLLTWNFFVDAHWWVPLCVQHPAKDMPFHQISIHALQYQHDIDVHLLFCFDFCLTWIFFIDPNWWVQLCMRCPAKAMPFQQIIMHALHYQHDVDVHLLFCFDIDPHLTCSQVHV